MSRRDQTWHVDWKNLGHGDHRESLPGDRESPAGAGVGSFDAARDVHADQRRRPRGRGAIERETLAELTRLVDEIEHLAPELAVRIDLEALLDRYATLTRAHDRASRAVSMANRAQLERMRDHYRGDPDANPKRLDMCERRLACHQHCDERAEWLADEIAIVVDFIRLVAQRTAYLEDPLPDDCIDRELSELEVDDAARRQLAMEFH